MISTRARRALAAGGFLLLAAGLGAANAPMEASDDREFQEARGLFWSGQYDQAEPLLKTYLLKHPSHSPSRAFLQMIQQARARNPSKIGETRKRLEGILLEEVKFDGADWETVLDFFKEKANPSSNGKDADPHVNFINLVPPSLKANVTLNLRKVSLLTAIRYACEMADLRYHVDSWAVIIAMPERTSAK
ncbi:MAG: hypothetical protein HUU04_07770 [Verrucomicrobiae bacterium]|nr:hypothetical protein [Verrucomicrobiae bacterium]